MRDNLLASHFEQIAPGMHKQQVEAILGMPRAVQNCIDSDFKPSNLPNCREVYAYPSWGIPLTPAVWVIWFDAGGIVIDKYLFVSW